MVEVGVGEHGATADGVPQVCADQAGVGQIRPGKDGASQPGTGEIYGPEVGVGQVRAGQVGICGDLVSSDFHDPIH